MQSVAVNQSDGEKVFVPSFQKTALGHLRQLPEAVKSANALVTKISKAEWAILLLMTVIGAYLRFPGLGSLSLYGDEDYTALAVTGILSHGLPYLPSHMLYWRAAPFSYVATLSAYLFGLDEFSLRLPGAIFGTLTIPVFYVLARRLTGILPAIVGTWLLVFSAWHVDMSREARMYAMFLAFFLVSLYCFYRGFVEGHKSWRLAAVTSAIFTLTLHALAGLVVAFWGLAFLLNCSRFSSKDKIYFISAEAALTGLWFGYKEAFRDPGEYTNGRVFQAHLPQSIGLTPKFWLISHALNQRPALFIGLCTIGALMLYALWLYQRDDRRRAGGLIVAVSIAIISLAILNLFGLIILAVFVLVFSKAGMAKRLLGNRYCQLVLVEAGCIFIFWLFYGLTIWRGEGLAIVSGSDLLRKVLKDCLSYPALHILLYFEAFPLMTGVVTAGTVAWVILPQISSEQQATIVFVWFWAPLFALGFLREWVELRYTVVVYPFYLMIFAWTISKAGIMMATKCQRAFINRCQTNFPVVLGMALSFVLVAIPRLNEAHGLVPAIQTAHLAYMQPISRLWHGFPYHPDNKSAGEYVRRNIKHGDSVMAMDAVEQYYYTGQVDYWLCPASDKAAFAFREGNDWYGIYTKARVLTRRSEVEKILHQSHGEIGTLWLITSAESLHRLSPDVRDFLKAEKSKIVFIGRDNETAVYRFDISA